MIPKIIHYCWLSKDAIPNDLQNYMSTWKKTLPDYEFMLWNFDRFDINTSLWVQQAFESKKYAFAADYIRLYALYHHGGIYLDMDVEVLKSFNDFLSLDTMVCYEKDGAGLEVATLGATKHQPWVKSCLDYYENRSFIKSDGSYDSKVLPVIVAEILISNNYKLLAVNNLEEALKVGAPKSLPVLRQEFFSPKSYISNKLETTSNTYSIHHFAGTWLPFYTKWEHTLSNFLGIRFRDILRRRLFGKLR